MSFYLVYSIQDKMSIKKITKLNLIFINNFGTQNKKKLPITLLCYKYFSK